MERILVYKKQKGILLFLTICGLFFFIFGLTLLTKSLIYGFKTEIFGGNWNYVIYTIQGLVFFILGHINKRNEKYFIEWDEMTLKYLLPQNKTDETIVISDIRKVSIQLFEIKIQLLETEKILSLENVQFKELRRIKEKFEEIKLNAEKKKIE